MLGWEVTLTFFCYHLLPLESLPDPLETRAVIEQIKVVESVALYPIDRIKRQEKNDRRQ
jgi:hypothetical protein